MIVFEFKAKGTKQQYQKIDEAIRITQFIRNKCLRFWMDNHNVKPYDLNKYTAVLANEFDFADKLNSMARQAAAERTAFAIKRFFDNCKAKVPGKKGYPRFQKNNRSVEYKSSGWKLLDDRKHIKFTDKCGIGQLKLIGTWDLHFYQIKQIKRVRIVKRSDGYYIQFCVDAERNIDTQPTGKTVGLDVGLNSFYTDSQGDKVDNPRYLRKSEKSLKRLQKRVSRKKKGSSNRKKAINRLGRKHLQVSRQRKDFAVKQALCVVKSNDLLAFEKLQVRNMVSQRVGRVSRLGATGEPVRVKNSKLAKSISDVSWSLFTQWLEYFGKIYGRVIVPVAPQYTSQNCSSCGEVVKKSLSVRTHVCNCGCILDRDHNAAINILAKALKQTGYDLSTVGRTETFNACGEMTLYPDLATSLGKVAH
jgi:putative transposase